MDSGGGFGRSNWPSLVTVISTDTDSRRSIISWIPLGRGGSAVDVEGIAVPLASDEASFATGEPIPGSPEGRLNSEGQ